MISRSALLVALAAALPQARGQQGRVLPDTLHRVTVVRGAWYSDRRDSTGELDLFPVSPRTGTAAPIVVFIHGGGLTSGDRRDAPAMEMCTNFTRAGIACASVNYRLVQQAKWPAQPQDVAAAIAWVLDNAKSMGVDAKRVFVFGHSSGCHLATVVATDTTYLAAHRRSPRDLAGVIAMGCLLHQVPPAISDSAELRRFFASEKWIYPSLEMFRAADPSSHVGPHVPSTLVLIAESEQTQPPILESARLFADRMRRAGRPADFEILPNRRHMTALTMMQDPLDPTFLRVVEFVSSGGTHR